jgi:hypothetical protein
MATSEDDAAISPRLEHGWGETVDALFWRGRAAPPSLSLRGARARGFTSGLPSSEGDAAISLRLEPGLCKFEQRPNLREVAASGAE